MTFQNISDKENILTSNYQMEPCAFFRAFHLSFVIINELDNIIGPTWNNRQVIEQLSLFSDR